MARLRAVLAASHASLAAVIHKNLHKCRNAFLHQDATRRDSGAPLQRSLPDSVAERENAATPCARQARHHVDGLGQAFLHIERRRLRKLHFQPRGQRNPSHSTTAAASYPDSTLRSPRRRPHRPEQPPPGQE
jgi:hypothetical protein